MRNLWCGYRGGAYSRAGTAFVGFSKQTGRAYPPRLVPYQFSINQGLALEFGNFYMRVISDGAFVTEVPIAITAATQANPCVLTTSGAVEAVSATANIGAVSNSYAANEVVTLAGGTFSTPTKLNVVNTQLKSLVGDNPGDAGAFDASQYAGGDTIALTGGVQTTPAQLTVTTTKVLSATVVGGGAGGTPGVQTVTGTTGTGTKFQASVNIGGAGSMTAVLSITVGGAYTVNPNTAAAPVTGGGLGGSPTLHVHMGVDTFTTSNAGVFTANAVNATFTQTSTSGSGTGATFKTALFAPKTLTVAQAGLYSTYPGNPVAQASTTGVGVGATYTVTTAVVSPFADGDWVHVSGVLGMTELDGNTYVAQGTTPTTLQLFDVYGNAVNSTAYHAYTSGGTVARIYTLPTLYAEADLDYLKWTQSADVMSIDCINQVTLTEYPPQDLARNASDTDWSFSIAVAKPTVAPPAAASAATSAAGTVTYRYVATAVSPIDGTESIASPIAEIALAVDLATTQGTITVSWTAVDDVGEYIVYKATPAYGSAVVPNGALYGYAGTAYGTQFLDVSGGIIPDFSQVPPNHHDPFARGQVPSAKVVAAGSGYTTIGYTIGTATGSGLVLELVLQAGGLGAVIVKDPGKGYLPVDTIVITGNGTGAVASLTIGAQTGTYPSVPAYFQERRFHANTLNNPDTYFASQPGSFTNFDYRIPTIASDAFTGQPWSQQVNGIQWMLNMPGGLVIFTGLTAYQLTGSGGSSLSPQAITPSSQQAQPQAANGCSATIPPIRIDNDIVFVQAKGSVYRDLTYQILTNIYTGADITINSSQLFTGYTIRQHAWCEEPYKILWAIRDDGVLLSLTYLKPQEVAGWARHDTNGSFVSCCAVTEPPVDALYVATQRFPGTHTAYMIERMDDRLWPAVEDVWAVDCGLALPQPAPNATLTVDTPTGLGALTGVTALVGGTGYSAGTTASVVDDNGDGPGSGAVVALTIAGGVITAVVFSTPGTLYTFPKLVFTDPANTGSGASARPILDNTATFTASAAIFSAPNIGSVIRMGGGIATITAVPDTTHATAQITVPITALRPNTTVVAPQLAGSWTMTAPVTTVSGLLHLAGATVTGLANGNVVSPRTVSATGTVTLDTAASSVTIGLGFQAQLQTVYLEAGEPTVQGQRKKVAGATVRLEASRGVKIGVNQPDGSTLSPVQTAPVWRRMTLVPHLGVTPYNSSTQPLYTGDSQFVPVSGGYAKPGQIALQQDFPLPMQVLDVVTMAMEGDKVEVEAKPRQQQRRPA